MERTYPHSTPSQQVNKSSRRRIRFVTLLMAAFLIWAIFILYEQFGQVKEKAQQLASIQSEFDQTKKLNGSLQLEVTRLNDPEYIKQMIRKDFYYTKKGETLFITPQTGP
ncbi:MAG: hypothetical protein A2189_03530 [Paenibacillus sp. RIFOXYA1_FULL_44_5]|nr:MAG: hypothetical protein A2189_03530 [Paenibacillus sp. RIFOXYA1_FULL_44_5]